MYCFSFILVSIFCILCCCQVWLVVAFLNCKFDFLLKISIFPSICFVPHLSPDAEIKYLQSLVNFIPVTISAGQEMFTLDRWVELGDQSQMFHLTCVSVFCYQSVQTSWPHIPRCWIQRCWCFCRSSWWPRIDRTDQAVPVRTKEWGKSQHSVQIWGRRMDSGQKCYPDQASILAQRSLVELLLFATVDVKNPACRGKCWPHKLTNNKIWAGTFFFLKKRENTYLMQRSWQPTAAYLQVGSTPMSYRVVFLTIWWERLNSVPLSVCFTTNKH